jgi:type IV pilus assembly protein PilQ
LRTNIGPTLTNTAQNTINATNTATFASGTADPTSPGGQNVNLPATGLNGFNAGSIAAVLYNRNFTRFISLELSALEADGTGKVISSPRVLTGDKVEALIEQGTMLPYQSATSSGATSVSFVKANLSLKVKPQITPDGNIIMTVDVSNDSVGATTAAGIAINTKHVKTEVLVENGGTVVIGGIYVQTVNKTITKVPLFGDIPVLGNLFKNTADTDNKTELLIFITPRIVDDRLTLR